MFSFTKKALFLPTLILTAISLGCFVIYFLAPAAKEWLKDIVLNLGTEIVGILLTIGLIDRVIRSNQEAERKKYQALAINQLRIPLSHHLGVFMDMFKASITSAPERTYQRVSDLFDDDYFRNVAFLDFSKQAPVTGNIQWFDYLSYEFSKFKDSLSRTIEKYSPYLDLETIDLVEQLLNSNLMAFIAQAPAIREIDKREGFKRAYNLFWEMQSIVKEYADVLSQLIEKYNQYAPDEKEIVIHSYVWSNNTSPQIGSGRIGRLV